MKKVLIIEDVRADAYLIAHEFLRLGFLPSVTTDGFEAVRSVAKAYVDIVSVDIGLVGESGIDIITEIRKVDKKIPIIVITAYDDPATVEKIVKAGADHLILKPFFQEPLKKIVREKYAA